jgi:hypothetical protein
LQSPSRGLVISHSIPSTCRNTDKMEIVPTVTINMTWLPLKSEHQRKKKMNAFHTEVKIRQ